MAPSFKKIIKSKYVKKLLPLAHARQDQEKLPSIQPSLCSVCKNLDPNLFEIRELRSPRLRVDWGALKQASNNCLSCSLLVKIIQRYFAKFEISPTNVRLVYEKTLCIDFGPAKKIMLYSTQTTPWSSIAIKEHVKGPNSSEESLRYVKQMLQKCSSNHKLCQTDAYLPTRLLDLGPPGNEYQSSFRLWETENMEASSANRYVCLSHCWGIKQPIITLKENLNEHRKKIPLEALPRTFTDAIDFTRRLGIRYLWIDSLCIVQNDKNDTDQEISQMSNIYQNCVICLASPGSESHSSGLYSDHPVDIEGFSNNDITTANHFDFGGQEWDVFAREPLDHYTLEDPSEIPSENHRPYTLKFRGWVYQERMLAPRFLHFLEKELAWDCRTESTCECDSQGWKSSMGHKKLAFSSELQSASRSVASVWQGIVESYTKLYLTYETDRLRAVAGIAQVFQKEKAPRSGYFAGIWFDSAVQDLLWEVWDERQGPKQARNEVVPSWSWASVSVWVGYPTFHDDFDELCTIMDMGKSGFQPTEKIEEQILTVHGFLLPATLGYREKEEGSNLRPYTLLLFDATEAMSLIEDDNLHLPGLSYVQSGEIVYYLVMGKTSSDYYHSIVLKAVNPSENMYRRIGTSGNGGHRFAGRLSEKSRIFIC